MDAAALLPLFAAAAVNAVVPGPGMMLAVGRSAARGVAAPEACEDRQIAFLPPIPVACIFAAGPERARAVPEG